jgi:acetamidase/formamidase
LDRVAAVTLHEIPLERRTLHGHFSADLEPILTVDSGDTIAFACLDAGWYVAPGEKFEPMTDRDTGHPLIGPVDVRGARAGQALEVRIDKVVPGGWGWTVAAGWDSPLNLRLGFGDGEDCLLRWTLANGIGRDEAGHEVELRPFLGVLGMPPPEPGTWSSTIPPRQWGGNMDCKELVEGALLYLPIPVDGARFSAGDAHARQGDGEVGGTAIECPLERAELTLTARDDLRIETPIARVAEGWITFGFDEDLEEAAGAALDAMLDLMSREHGLARREALALASVVVDLRVTQLVNGSRGVHAVLPDNALR